MPRLLSITPFISIIIKACIFKTPIGNNRNIIIAKIFPNPIAHNNVANASKRFLLITFQFTFLLSRFSTTDHTHYLFHGLILMFPKKKTNDSQKLIHQFTFSSFCSLILTMANERLKNSRLFRRQTLHFEQVA